MNRLSSHLHGRTILHPAMLWLLHCTGSKRTRGNELVIAHLLQVPFAGPGTEKPSSPSRGFLWRRALLAYVNSVPYRRLAYITVSIFYNLSKPIQSG